MYQSTITDDEFNTIRSFIYKHAGISLSTEKKPLVTSRLGKRLRHHSLENFSQYIDLLKASTPTGEQQIAIDLLTTNETYFFREPKHFAFLEHTLTEEWQGRPSLKVWSAASSTGEEAYSIAMLLDDVRGTRPWEIFGSDISSRVLNTARQGVYQQQRIDGIPPAYLKKYCLKGTGDQTGLLLVDQKLRAKVNFSSVNLIQPIGNIGLFDIIFLRNVLIYFDMDTKRKIIKQLVDRLQPDGYLFIGHSESLKGIHDGLETVIPTVYQRKK